MPARLAGVGGGDVDNVAGFAIARGAERLNGLGQSVLFAAEAGDEAASADLAAGFEAAQDVEQIAPFGGVGLAGEQVAEEDSVASEEHTSGGFERGVVAAGLLDRGWGGVDLFGEKRPASGGAAAGAVASFGARGLAACGVSCIHAGTELVEAIGGGEAGGGELPESVLGLLAGETGDALNVVSEAGSALREELAELQGLGAEGLLQAGLFDGLAVEGVRQPVGGLADVEGDGRGVGGDDAARGGAIAN